MTIPVQQIRYVYDGPYSVSDTAPIPFSYSEPEHVKALRDKQPLEINVEYSVSGQNIILLVPIAASEHLVIYRETPMNNDAEFPQEAKFDSEKITDAIDKLTMQNQEQEDALNRAIKLPLDADPNIQNLDLPLPEANKGLKWNATEDGLVNTKYDTDEIADIATEQAEIATQQAALATLRATEAAESAQLAADKAQEVTETAQAAIAEIAQEVADALSETDAIKDAAQEAITNAKDSAISDIETAAGTAVEEATTAISSAKDTAVGEVEASADATIALAQSWAVGTITDRPEGSAKWWAQQAQQIVQGDSYTKLETDALLLQKEDVFTVGSNLTMSEERVLDVNTTTLNQNFPTKTDMSAAITASATTKQDKLIAGSGIAIAEDGKTISADLSGVDAYTKSQTDSKLAQKQDVLIAGDNIIIAADGKTISATTSASIDAYTKTETNQLLSGKQDKLVAGSGIELDGNTISSSIDTYSKEEIQGLLNVKQNALTPGEYIKIEGNVISATPEDMISTFSEGDWNDLSPEEQSAIKLALIYE